MILTGVFIIIVVAGFFLFRKAEKKFWDDYNDDDWLDV